MSFRMALCFAWVQGAQFYADLHEEAVAPLPPGEGTTWLDVGCPGRGSCGYDS